MLKTLTKDDTTTTPYVATKNWNLSNVANDDVVLAENGNPVAAENVDYFPTTTQANTNCNVAKEDQELDLVNYREGLKRTGLFYPDSEPVNLDGTFKRMVYTQIKTMFYNNYRDPTKMWGTEKIDFDTSQVKKFLSDSIKLFDIPTNIMGQKIVEGSVSIIDNTLDNDYLITDDKNCNLFAGVNLFSKQQELGDFNNIFQSGSDGTCTDYFTFTPPTPSLTGSLFSFNGSFASASLSWSIGAPVLGFGLERSTDNVTFTADGFFDSVTFSTYDFPLSGSADYYYRIYAFNSWGSSPYSNTVHIFTIDCTLYNSLGTAYVLGPYDTFECQSTGALSGSNLSFGWASGWDIRAVSSPDFIVPVAIDSMDDYIASSGSIMIGLNSGSGWAAPWTGTM